MFFVKDFDGNPDHVTPSGTNDAPAGRKIEVTFLEGEVIKGTTLSYRPDGSGYSRGNNLRIFVVGGAVQHVRFP